MRLRNTTKLDAKVVLKMAYTAPKPMHQPSPWAEEILASIYTVYTIDSVD
jgi:hypothetical protein